MSSQEKQRERHREMNSSSIKYLVSTVLLCVVISLPITAQAILVADGLIVRDTDTNLEWLKLTETFGMTYGEVTGQLGVGGAYDGMRYATNQEVVDLFGANYAINLTASPLPEHPGYLDPGVRQASEILGDGVSGGTDAVSGPNANYFLAGLTADLRLDGSRFILGAHTRWSDTDYFTVRDPWWSGYSVIMPSSTTGSYLVRPVPVPAAVWLFGSGLLGLFGMARRKEMV